MNTHIRDLPLHHGLARLFETLGTLRFWRWLALLIQKQVPIDNALVAVFMGQRTPLILEECTFGPQSSESPMPFYCDGLYLLDPFFSLASEPFADGLYRLHDVAPNGFLQSEYYKQYMLKEVGIDEVQYLCRVDDGHVLSLSLGSFSSFDNEALGKLQAMLPWVITAMQKQYQLMRTVEQQTSEPSVSRASVLSDVFDRSHLSKRETEIIGLTLQGLSAKAIAQRLCISPETVKVHRRNVHHKLGISSNTELFGLFISQLESRKSAPSAVAVLRLADVLA